MSEIINTCVAALNGVGREFWEYAVGMFLQTGVLVAVLLIVDFLLRRRVRATLRYWIWMLVFAKLLLPPDLSIPTGIGYWCGPSVSRTAAQPAAAMAPRDARPVSVPADTLPAPAPEEPPRPAPVHLAPAEPVAMGSESLTWQGGVLLLWGAGVLAFAGLVIQRWLFVRVLIAQGEPASDDLADLLEQCRRRAGVRRSVDLKLSPNTFSPAVCGLFRLTILMPAGLLDRLSPQDLKTVLIHELAHVRRGDLWVNSLQTALQVAYFYNPLVWLANAIVRRVREQAVDEMVLVALGAEAKSYSRTLIDIAEMAFLRVSPALRLIGVAESRKSLEGRIRHMMTRPMPKSARVGMVGVLAIAAIGAILLPMAGAAVEPQQRFVANLPGGATVELVGVCNWPASGRIAWRADGPTLDPPLYASKWNVRPSADRYGFLFRVTGTDDIDPTWNGIEGSEGWEGSCDVVDDQGNRLEDCVAAVAQMKEPPARTTLRIGLATGPWRTISSHDGRQMSSGQGQGVLWSQAFESSSGTYIVASAEQQGQRKHRVAAVDAGGALHVAPGPGSVSSGSVHQFTAHFPDLKPGQIREFQYQIRECRMIEFRGVSLRPGQKTDVQVLTENRPVASTTDQVKQVPGGSRSAGASIVWPDRSGKGWDVAAERFDVQPASTQGTYRAVVSIRNRGGATCPQVAIRFNVGDPTVDTPIHAAGPLKPDEVWNEASNEFIPREGANEIRVSLDPDNLVEELDETNNFAALRVVVKDGRIVEQAALPAAVTRAEPEKVFRDYLVDRRVADFPAGEDFSTPEAAYATISRMDQGDPSAWKKVSVARMASRFGGDSERRTTVDSEWAKVLGSARIREVLVWNMTRAAVIAELPQEASGQKIAEPIDRRSFELENGRWLNTGNSRFNSVEEAKAQFGGWMQRETAQADAMRDPLAHADEIKVAAARLFEKLRTADYAKILSYYHDGKWEDDGWKKFPTLGLYTVHTDYPSFALWCARHFKDNPIVDVQLGDVFIGDALIAGKTGRPTVPYKLTLQDGTVLAGNLPFEYEINQGQGHWNALEGIDWHLWPNGTK